jgi:DNA invertase Pin-like site-specific DNA recombinase
VFREEGVSASTPLASRPAGARLLELVKAGVVKHIVAMNLDRLFRSAEDALRMTHKWGRRGVTLYLLDADGRAMDTSSVGGLLLLSGLAVVAAMERNLIAERTPAAAMAFMRKRGVVYAPTPYGCQRSGAGVSRTMQKDGRTHTLRGESGTQLVDDPTERMVVEQMQAARSEGMSLRAIAGLLNREKVPCKRGGAKWYGSTVRSILASRTS